LTQIDFYTYVDDKLHTACRLAAKAAQQGARIMVFTPDADTTDRVDRMLWTSPATGFLPHCRSGDDLAPRTPVIVDHLSELFVHDDILLNLHPDWPPFFSRFRRLVEIVARDDEDRERGRVRYRFYRDRGYEIRHHDMSGERSNAG